MDLLGLAKCHPQVQDLRSRNKVKLQESHQSGRHKVLLHELHHHQVCHEVEREEMMMREKVVTSSAKVRSGCRRCRPLTLGNGGLVQMKSLDFRTMFKHFVLGYRLGATFSLGRYPSVSVGNRRSTCLC